MMVPDDPVQRAGQRMGRLRSSSWHQAQGNADRPSRCTRPQHREREMGCGKATALIRLSPDYTPSSRV